MSIDPIVARLKEARIAAGLSQAKVAELAGVTPSTVSEAERGLHATTLPKLNRWAAALGRELTLQELRCYRCGTDPAVGQCCSTHGKHLCHSCYRRTHFVEVCIEGCELCRAEGLSRVLKGVPGPGSTSPEPGPHAEGYPHYGTGPDGECFAHGAHPHAGMTCLDCPVCRPAEPTKGGTE